MKILHSLTSSVLAISASGLMTASAAVSYVENANIAIPANFGGVYLNLNNSDTNSSSSSGTAGGSASYTISYSEPAASDWDFNFFLGGVGIAHNSTANPYRDDDADNLSAIHALGVNDSIDGTSVTPSGALPLSSFGFGGSGAGAGGGSGVSTS